ncbi:MAG TPA: hypothetical protein VI168_14600, partial [Croceibacterium sp.]
HRTEQRMNLWRRRTMPEDAVVHDVAWQIAEGYAKRLPARAVRLSEKQWNAARPAADPPAG